LEGLRDIKGIVEVPDISLYLFIGVVGLALVLFVFVVYKIWKKFQQPKNQKALYLQKLKNLNLTQSKKTAYFITEASIHVCDSESKKNVYASLEPKLAPYKYKKYVDAFDMPTKEAINHFLAVIDE
jgi:hypothetical protein